MRSGLLHLEFAALPLDIVKLLVEGDERLLVGHDDVTAAASVVRLEEFKVQAGEDVGRRQVGRIQASNVDADGWHGAEKM